MTAASGWRSAPVSLTFWNDLKVRGWTDDQRLAALYLLTNPHCTGEGFYHLPLELAAGDLQWPMDRFRCALGVLVSDDFVDVDERARLVLIVKALKHAHPIKGAPSLRGALNALARANGSPRLFARFIHAADQYQPDLAAAIRGHYSIS